MVSTFERLREERERLGLSQAQMAELAGQSRKSQIRYESGERSPDGDYFSAVSKHGVDIVYVLTGHRSPLHGQMQQVRQQYGAMLDLANLVEEHEQATFDAIPEGGFVPVPVHEFALAAGDGAENGSEEIVDYLAFRKDWLHRIGASARNAALARAKGDSMAPTIHNGDMLLIDTTVLDAPFKLREPNDTRPATIYALRDSCGARVKRIERIAPGKIMLLSDNPAFAPEVIADNDVTILGKVIWWGHTNKE